MVKAVLYLKVKDYNTFKKSFDKVDELRTKYQNQGVSIGNVKGEKNNICIISEWKSIENLNSFYNSTEIKQAMKEGGVISQPELTIIENVMERSLQHH